MSILNPCMTCGACCACFRVSFYWAEGDDASGRVPASLTEPVTPFYVVWPASTINSRTVKHYLEHRATTSVALFMKTALQPVVNFRDRAKEAK